MAVGVAVEAGRPVGVSLGLESGLLTPSLSSQKARLAGVVSGNSGGLLTPVEGVLRGYRVHYPRGIRGGSAP
jgi:hypothetical protein